MSLATRCTTCGTVFRVVQDQLKVSEGWVRCGRCSAVFNALEGLFDLERDAPPDGPVGTAAPSTLPAVIAAGTESIDADPSVEAAPARADDESSADAIDKIDAQLMRSRESEQGSTPATRIGERDRLEFPDAQFDSEMLADNVAPPTEAAGDLPSAADIEVAPEALAADPEFIQRAQRLARWQRSPLRALQAAAVVALLALLGVQAAHHQRDSIAARWPAAMPVLSAWCAALSCTIGAPRRIEDVAVESTGLTRSGVPDAFQLSVVLRNRGAMTVAQPSIDLSLTDPNGQLIARRVLAPRDFRVASGLIRPGAESALQLMLTAGGARITGYTVEVFYP